jgi:hypothetical protein
MMEDVMGHYRPLNIVKRNEVGNKGGRGNGGYGVLVSGDGNGDTTPVEIEGNTVKASGLAGIKVEGAAHGLD